MKEDIIRMAREAGFTVDESFGFPYAMLNEKTFLEFNAALERFAAIVADRCAEIAYEAEPWHSADLIRKAFGVQHET